MKRADQLENLPVLWDVELLTALMVQGAWAHLEGSWHLGTSPGVWFPLSLTHRA